MPERDEHIKKAERNLKLSEEGIFNPDKTKYLDWYVTILFYIALHYIDSVLATYSSSWPETMTHPREHKRRDNLVRTVSPLSTVAVEYFMLKEASRRARYCTDYDTGDPRARKEAIKLIFCVDMIKQTISKSCPTK